MITLRAWAFECRPTELRYGPPSEAGQHIPLPSFERCDKCVNVASIYGHRLTAGLNSRMKRPAHKFKIGQQVFHHSGGLPGGKRTGPYTVIGLAWQSSGTMLYRIKSETREQLAYESELKLVLLRARKTSD
jgi:hypothetical protein